MTTVIVAADIDRRTNLQLDASGPGCCSGNRMMPEVRKIPAAPRRVRGGPILAHRWPMAAVGAFLAGFGCLLSWMLFLAEGAKPSDEQRLEDGPNLTVDGTITKLNSELIHGPDGSTWQYVDFDFRYRGVDRSGSSMARHESLEVGERVRVEIAPESPGINRVEGGRRHFDRVLLRPETWLAMMVGPGLFLLFGWVTGTFRLRQVLVHGDVSTGRLVAARPVRWVIPDSLVITFEFRDHRAVLRRGHHWVRARSSLGMQVRRQMETGWFESLPVLHDRQLPQWNRMVLAHDFLPGPDMAAEFGGLS